MHTLVTRFADHQWAQSSVACCVIISTVTMPSSWRQAGSLGRLRRKPVHREHDQPLPHPHLRVIIYVAIHSPHFVPSQRRPRSPANSLQHPALDNCANCSSQGSPQPSTSALRHLVVVQTSQPWKLSTCCLLHQLSSLRLPLFIVNLDNHQSVLSVANVRSPSVHPTLLLSLPC